MTAPPRHSRFTPQIPAHPHEARLDRPSSCIPLPVWDILGVGFFFGCHFICSYSSERSLPRQKPLMRGDEAVHKM